MTCNLSCFSLFHEKEHFAVLRCASLGFVGLRCASLCFDVLRCALLDVLCSLRFENFHTTTNCLLPIGYCLLLRFYWIAMGLLLISPLLTLSSVSTIYKYIYIYICIHIYIYMHMFIHISITTSGINIMTIYINM